MVSDNQMMTYIFVVHVQEDSGVYLVSQKREQVTCFLLFLFF